MKRLVISALVMATLASAWPAAADSPMLREKRDNSCGTKAFQVVGGGYRNLNHNVVGRTQVGEAVLEWCQDAKNAVIYFYVDDPARRRDEQCSENMSIAIFPGRGAEAEQIVRDNEPSYYAPNVKLIQEPTIAPVTLQHSGHAIAAYKLEAVLIDSGGSKRRQTMIGYQRGPDFIRVMSGVVEEPACANATTRSFMDKLDWP
jgi:hypothetical protein